MVQLSEESVMRIRFFGFLLTIVVSCGICFAQVQQQSFFAELPPHGFGILERIINQTVFPIDFLYEKHMHDNLPQGTVVRIKNKALDKYYRIQVLKDGSYSFKADGDNPQDPGTHFIIERRFSPNLQSWIGFSHNAMNRNILQVDEKNKQLAFTDREFADEEAEKSHWEIVGGDFKSDVAKIKNCYLQNRKTKGSLSHFKGEVDVEVTPGRIDFVDVQATWGISFKNIREKIAQQKAATDASFKHYHDVFDAVYWLKKKSTRNAAKARVEADQNELARLEQGLIRHQFNGDIYRYDMQKNAWILVPGLQAKMLAVCSEDQVYALTEKNELHVWENNEWHFMQEGVINIAANADGSLCYTTDGELAVLDFEPLGLDGLPEKKEETNYETKKKEITQEQVYIKKCGCDKNNVVWAVATDGLIYYYQDKGEKKWIKNTPVQAILVDIAVAWDGDVWVVDNKGSIYIYKSGRWSKLARQIPGDLATFGLAHSNYAWATNKEGKVFVWNGQVWTQVAVQPEVAMIDSVATASGAVEHKIPGKIERRVVERASVYDIDGKPLRAGGDIAVDIEIVQLGVGGGINSLTTVNLGEVPFEKKPRIIGFAKESINNFDRSLLLSVMPLQSKGTAWLSSAMRNTGKATVSFLARAQSSGDIQVVFGNGINDSYLWRVVIGGWSNTKAAILKYGVANPVVEVARDQNQLAAAIAGNFIPYWVSINDGLILVGMGEPGENVFLSWRDPNPPSNVSHVGFSSHSEKVEYMQIYLQEPVVPHAPSRTYFPNEVFQKSPDYALTPSKNAITWTNLPFRQEDSGSVCFSVVGDDQAVVILGADPQANTNFYALVFGDVDGEGQKGLALKRYALAENKLETLYFLKEESFPGICIDAKKAQQFWISFYFGEIIVGSGKFGENVLMVHRDIAPLTSINALGFGAWGDSGVRFGDVSVAPSLPLGSQTLIETYRRSQQIVGFSGGVEIILPFDYEFMQDKARVGINDRVRSNQQWAAATPEKGTFYYFEVAVLPNGAPQLRSSRDKERRALIQFQRELFTMDAQKERIAMEQQVERQKGSLDRAEKEVEATRTRSAQYETENLVRLSAQISPTIPAYGETVVMATMGVHAATSVITGQLAASQQKKGALLELDAQRRALERDSEIAQLTFQQRLMKGEAQFAFSGNDSYVYVDKPGIPDLGDVSIPEQARQNKQLLEVYLQNVAKLGDESIDNLISEASNMLYAIDHYFVVSDARIKQLLFNFIERLNRIAEKAAGYEMPFFDILFGFYNNSFLVNESNADESVVKARWLVWINALGRRILQMPHFELAPCFGEYIWHATQFTRPGYGTIMFDVQGGNDVFICFTNDIRHKIRNSDKDIYEIVIGGWNNEKSAIRLTSLGKSVAEVSFYENNMAALNPHGYESYWISLNNGEIMVGRGKVPGQNVFLSWRDPYPIQNIRYIGLSNWNAPLVFNNFTFYNQAPVQPVAQHIDRASREVVKMNVGSVSSERSSAVEVIRDEVAIEEELIGGGFI